MKQMWLVGCWLNLDRLSDIRKVCVECDLIIPTHNALPGKYRRCSSWLNKTFVVKPISIVNLQLAREIRFNKQMWPSYLFRGIFNAKNTSPCCDTQTDWSNGLGRLSCMQPVKHLITYRQTAEFLNTSLSSIFLVRQIGERMLDETYTCKVLQKSHVSNTWCAAGSWYHLWWEDWKICLALVTHSDPCCLSEIMHESDFMICHTLSWSSTFVASRWVHFKTIIECS